jgi:hypothetical protein
MRLECIRKNDVGVQFGRYRLRRILCILWIIRVWLSGVKLVSRGFTDLKQDFILLFFICSDI